MPTILPRAERTRTIPGVSGNVQINVGAAGQAGAGLSKVADTVSGIIQEHATRIKRQDDINQEILLRSQYDDESRAFTDLERQKTGSDAFKNVERGKEFRASMLKKYTGDVKSPNVKTALTQYINSRGSSMLDSLSIHQSKQRAVISQQVRDSTIDGLLKDAYGGDSLEEVNARWTDVIAKQNEAGTISEEEAIEQIKVGQSTLAESHLDGLINTDPTLAIDQIETGAYNQFLTQEQIEAFDKKAKALEAAIEKDINAQKKEKERLAKIALKESQKETGDQFLQALLDGTLKQSDVLKSNLNPTGENSKKTWIKEIEARAKKTAKGDDEWKTDPVIEAGLQTKITQDPESVTDIEIMNMQGNGLSTDDAKAMVAYKKRRTEKADDPQKTQDAKAAYTRLREAKTAKLFSGNKKKNSKEWAEAVNMLSRFIENHPDENPADYVDQLLEPAKDGVLRRVFDFLPFVDPAVTEEERQAELDLDAGLSDSVEAIAEDDGGKIIIEDDSRAVSGKVEGQYPKKKVTVKIIKKADGTHEALYPNGVRRTVTLDEKGKVVF